MNYGGQGPGLYGSDGPPEYPGQVPGGQYGPPPQTPGGSIRNNLGAGLKQSGFFQKDGQINNLRGGFIGPKQPQPSTLQGMSGELDPRLNPGYGNFQTGMPTQAGQAVAPNYGRTLGSGFGGGMSGRLGGGGSGKGPFSFLGSGASAGNPNLPRQLILQASQEGIVGNGVATISPDNFFFLVANLPSPHTFLNQGQGSATYASYLVDNKGQTGFLAGVLRPIGNGVYQTQFRSSVPLSHYNRVVVSVENPQYLGQTPNGPIILKVKEPMGAVAFLSPMKNAGGSLWKKVSGLFRGKSKEIIPPVVPESSQVAPELIQSLNQMGVSVNPAPPTLPPSDL
ncbi:MAG: hypothetical protein ACYDEJ_16060 [Desulfitobacteriaceae bacterium]